MKMWAESSEAGRRKPRAEIRKPLLSSVPFHRSPQALFKMHFRFVAETGLGLRDVSQRVLDIAAALRVILWLSLIRRQNLQQLEGFVEIDSAAGGDVEGLPGCLVGRSGTGEQIRLDSIVDIGEVAALLAVAEDRGLFAAQH